MSKNNPRKIHIHGNLTTAEAEVVAQHFGAREIKRIPGGHISEITKALACAAKAKDMILFQQGLHFVGVLNLSDLEWFVFQRDGAQIVVRKRTPRIVEMQEVARFETAPQQSAAPPPTVA